MTEVAMWVNMSVVFQWLLILSTAVFTIADVSHLSRRPGEQRAQHVRGNDGHYDANDGGTAWNLRLAVPGEPGRDYPVLAAIPKTGFSCSGKNAGYYADTDAACQVFRICTTGATFGYQSFLCPNGTLFNQEYLVCDWWMHVRCSASQNYYNKNDKVGSLKLSPQMMKDVQKMIIYPMKNPLDSNSLSDDKMVMQLYNPPSGQIALPFNINENYNSGLIASNTYNPNTNNPVAHYINEASLPPTHYEENAFSASTPSSLYLTQSEPLSDLGQTFSITPSKELEVTFKKQQYTYPSQYDKQVTYKLSQLANNNQNTLYNLANLQQQQQIKEAQQNLVSESDQKSKINNISNSLSHLTTVVSGTLVKKSLIVNKEIKTSPRLPVSRVSLKKWAPRMTKSIPISSRQYLAPTTESNYLAPLPLPLEEQTLYYRSQKKSAPLTDARTSTQSKYTDDDSNNNLIFTEILTKKTLDDTVSNIVEETSQILEKTPLEKASKIIKEVSSKTSANTTYLPANDFDEANDVENIDRSELEPIKQSEQKSGRLTNAPSNALEPPTSVTSNVFRNPTQLTTLPYYKQKVNGKVPLINYTPSKSPEKSISVKLSLPEKIVSYVLNAQNYTNLDHLEVFNTGNTNYLLLTNGNASKDRKFIPLGKLVFANPFNVSNSQGHALNFLNNAQSSQYQQTNNAKFGSAAFNNFQQNTNLINEQNQQLLSQLPQFNIQQPANSHTFEQLRQQDDDTSTHEAVYNSANDVQEHRGVQNSQLFDEQSGRLLSGQSGQYDSGYNSQLINGQHGSSMVSGQLRQYNENEAMHNPRQDFQITNQKSHTVTALPNVHSQNANFITQQLTSNQNSPSAAKYSLTADEQNGNFYSSQFSSGNPSDISLQRHNTNSNQSGKLRNNDQVSSLYQYPESQSNRYQTSQNVQSVDTRNGKYLAGAFGINRQQTYNQAVETTKATLAENSDVETFSTLDGQGQSGKLLQAPTILPTQNTVSQVNDYQVANFAGANDNFANTFGQYRSVHNDQYNSLNALSSVSGQNPITTSGRYTAQPVQPSALRAEEITTTVQFIPSLSFELNNENGEDNFFAALKNGIIGEEAPINRVDSGNLVSSYVSQSPVENVRSAPISSVGYKVRHAAPVYRGASISSYSGPSSYLAPQSSVGKLDTAGPVLAAELAQAKQYSRAYIPPRLEDLGESAGYPKEHPSIPFTF